jgi:hypothetical protein
MLIIGQPDKMLRDLSNSKGSIELLISNFRHVVHVVCFFLLGTSPVSEFRRRGITQKEKTYKHGAIRYINVESGQW